jgi:hypothetical protein
VKNFSWHFEQAANDGTLFTCRRITRLRSAAFTESLCTRGPRSASHLLRSAIRGSVYLSTGPALAYNRICFMPITIPSSGLRHSRTVSKALKTDAFKFSWVWGGHLDRIMGFRAWLGPRGPSSQTGTGTLHTGAAPIAQVLQALC